MRSFRFFCGTHLTRVFTTASVFTCNHVAPSWRMGVLFRQRTSYHVAPTASTIYALSSGPTRSAIAIVRVSGPQAHETLQALCPGKPLPPPRQASFQTIMDPVTSTPLDHGIVIRFPGPKSFTGEDVVEFQLHGGRAVITATLRALGSLEWARLAEPGEFTKRAYFNGRMDLTEVEGLADLLAADTESQRHQALRQLGGSLRTCYEEWRKVIVSCLAHVEAVIDFEEEEEDMPHVSLSVARRVAQLREDIICHLDDGRRGEIVRDGVQVAIVGPSNAGKSTLLNVLAKRQAAIVSPIPGTTRDIIQILMDIEGVPVVLVDTAGIRQTEDLVEREGVRRTWEAIKGAHLTICVLDGDATIPTEIRDAISEDTMVVVNKADLFDSHPLQESTVEELRSRAGWLGVMSCKTGDGVNAFLDAVATCVRKRYDSETREGPLLSRARHRQHLTGCVAALDRFLDAFYHKTDVVLAAEELRDATRSLGMLTGRVEVEEMLGVLFQEFCIGK